MCPGAGCREGRLYIDVLSHQNRILFEHLELHVLLCRATTGHAWVYNISFLVCVCIIS